MSGWKQYLIPFLVGVVLVCSMLVSFAIGRARGYDSGYSDAMNQPHKADTVWKTDTNFIDRPVEIIKWKDREKLVYIPVADTLSIHDTTFLALPREYKQYGNETYQAQISGVNPSLDWIKVYPKTAYITNTVVEKKRWSWSATVGPGVFYNGSAQFGVGAVIGFGYNF